MVKQWQSVLDYWFQGENLGSDQMNRWWKKDEEVDKWISEHFDPLIDQVNQSLYRSWGETPHGRLAAVICLDQFSRNAYRGSSKSFSYDSRAKMLVDEGLLLGQDASLSLLEQSFFILPLMHDENLNSQDRCVAFFQSLVSQAADGQLKDYLSGSLLFAIKHRDIISKFGRYPHRNELLGRISTEEELLFLQQPGSSF